MRRTIAVVGVALLGLGFLTGCTPSAGTVIAREYDDPDTWMANEPIEHYGCLYEYGYNWQTGKYEYANICKYRTVGYRLVERTDEAHWKVKISDGEDSGWVEVDEDTYNRLTVGTYYDHETGQITAQG